MNVEVRTEGADLDGHTRRALLLSFVPGTTMLLLVGRPKCEPHILLQSFCANLFFTSVICISVTPLHSLQIKRTASNSFSVKYCNTLSLMASTVEN
jgi:hypothetical protein